MVNPVDKVVIQRLDHDATNTSTMVITIKPTVAEHNVVVETIRRLRQDYPGAWAIIEDDLRKERIERERLHDNAHKVKSVSAEYLEIANDRVEC